MDLLKSIVVMAILPYQDFLRKVKKIVLGFMLITLETQKKLVTTKTVFLTENTSISMIMVN